MRSRFGLGVATAGTAAAYVGASFHLLGGMAPAMVAAPFLALALFLRPAWGIVLVVAVHPWNTVSGGVNVAVSYVLPLGVLFIGALHAVATGTVPRQLPGGLGIWFLLWVGWILVAGSLVGAPRPALVQAVQYSWLGLVLLAAVNLLDRRRLEWALLGIPLAVAPIAMVSLWQIRTVGFEFLLFSHGGAPQRVTSLFSDPNTLGVTMTHALVIAGSLLASRFAGRRSEDGPSRIPSAVLLVLMVALLSGLLSSVSRSSFIYAAAAALVLAGALPRLRPALYLGAAAVTSLTLLPIFEWISFALRLGGGLSHRNELWGAAWAMIREHPWTGIGPGALQFEALRGAYMSPMAMRDLTWAQGGAAHNVLLSKAAELGIPGLLLAVFLFVLLWTRIPGALRRYREGDWVAGAAAAGVIGLSIRGLFETGTTLGLGHLADSLVFFLFALILLGGWSPLPRRIAVPADSFRSGRTGGQRMWAVLIDRWRKQHSGVVCEDQIAPPPGLQRSAWGMMLWYGLAYSDIHRGILVADSSQAGRLSLLLRRLRRRTGVRVMTVVHHLRRPDEFRRGRLGFVMPEQESALLRASDRVIVHTEHERAQVAARGVAKERISVVPVGAAKGASPVVPREIPSDEPLRLLWIGGDFERKGLPVLCEALSRTTGPTPRLSVVGAPSSTAEARLAEGYATDRGLPVSFLGRVSDAELAALWREHDVFVLPSLHEGHGSSLDEAMVRGLPCVASDLPVIRERLPRGAARLVPPGEPGPLAKALDELRSPEARAGLARGALRAAEAFPDWEDTYAAYDRILLAELERVPSP